jgi:hypothetical protein
MHRRRADVARRLEFPFKRVRAGVRRLSGYYLSFSSCTGVMAGYNRGIMPRVGEFCPSNIARLLLGVVIVVTLVAAIGVWLFHSPGRGTPIEQPSTTAQPVK